MRLIGNGNGNGNGDGEDEDEDEDPGEYVLSADGVVGQIRDLIRRKRVDGETHRL